MKRESRPEGRPDASRVGSLSESYAASPTPLEGLYTNFREYLYIPDTAVLDAGLAVVVAHRQGGDPLWVMAIGASGGGKTEVIRALNGVREVYDVTSLNTKTLLSGMYTPKKDDGTPDLKRDPSLLIRMTANGKSIMAFKDFTTVLQMKHDDRQFILGQFREVYDGYISKDQGTGRRVEWKGRLGFFAGVTGVIDTYRSVLAVLGERFVYLRLEPVDRMTLSAKAREQTDENVWRPKLQKAVVAFLKSVDLEVEIADTDGEWLDSLAVLASWVRTGVLRDEYRPDQVLTRPDLDAPTRLVKQLRALFRALLAMGHPDPKGFVERVTRDSVPRIRWDVLLLLEEAEPNDLTTREIADGLRLPRTQNKLVLRVMEDLEMLWLVEVIRQDSPEDGGKFPPNHYRLTDEAKAALKAAGQIQDTGLPPVENRENYD